MNNYELTIVLAGSLTPAKQKNITEKLEKLIDIYKGKVKKTDNWGKIEMSYPIKKETTGVYTLYDLELDPQNAKTLSDKLRLEEEILRYLLIKKN